MALTKKVKKTVDVSPETRLQNARQELIAIEDVVNNTNRVDTTQGRRIKELKLEIANLKLLCETKKGKEA